MNSNPHHYIDYEIIHHIERHEDWGSLVVEIVKFHNDSSMKRTTRIIKFTYKSDTFSDSFKGEIWDGNTNKWNHLFDMTDLGFAPQGDSKCKSNTNIGITEQRIKDRIVRHTELYDKGWVLVCKFFDLE